MARCVRRGAVRREPHSPFAAAVIAGSAGSDPVIQVKRKRNGTSPATSQVVGDVALLWSVTSLLNGAVGIRRRSVHRERILMERRRQAKMGGAWSFRE
jgi:hypothetical protein